ncbi:MAG: hypothetical protein IKW45_05450 [Clostridia bacterium]|nr:hypothetical protein [Clostridia bacterium]
MNNYNIRLDKYGISKAAFEELRAFCFQYEEKKAKIKDAVYFKNTDYSKVRISDGVKDPTEKAFEIAEKYREDVELIEKTAKEVDEFLAPWIIKGVTQDLSTLSLISRGMPACRNVYNQKRRQFYCLLALKKHIV